jgi:hypothetical protein
VREALAARSGRDFVVSGPSAAAAAGKHCARLLGGALLFVLRRPAVTLCVLVVAIGFAAVARNALVGQSARHPAPLFGSASDKRVAPAPLPPLRPVAVPAPAVATPVTAPPAAPAASLAPTPPPKPAASRDPIGDLIRSGEPAAAPSKPEAARIAAAQRALTKLGYGPLKADGMAGAGTRQAIERFEKERRLPVSGELTPRTVKELSAQAGLPIE